MSAPAAEGGHSGPLRTEAIPDLDVVRRTISRRAFLVVGAGGAMTATGLTRLAGRYSVVELPQRATLLATPALTKSIAIRRPEDQCVLVLDLYNMEPDFSGQAPIIRQPHPNQPSYLSVTLKPQHVTEESFILTDAQAHALKAQPGSSPPTHSSLPPSAPPVDSAVAGGSQLVFIVPSNLLAPNTTTPLAYETATLLDWSTLAMNVVPNAVPQGAVPRQLARPSAPDPAFDTAIELPFRVQISPVGSVAWVNASTPVTGTGGWTEQWHTRLAAAVFISTAVGPPPVVSPDTPSPDTPSPDTPSPDTPSPDTPSPDTLAALVNPQLRFFEDDAHRDDRTIRAIWCLDPGFANTFGTSASLPATDIPFNTSLQPRDRADIVRLSSDFALVAHNRQTSSGAAFIPSAATVDRLILTSYGATMDVEDHWDLNFAGGDYNSSLLQWRHRTWGGARYLRAGRPQGLRLPVRPQGLTGDDQRAQVVAPRQLRIAGRVPAGANLHRHRPTGQEVRR